MSAESRVRRPRHPKPTVAQNAGRHIRRAADIIEDRGWVQGTDGSKDRGFCIRGAVGYVVPEESFTLTWLVLHEWLRNIHGPGSAVAYNDEKGRTKEEVLFTLRKCADELDPGINRQVKGT